MPSMLMVAVVSAAVSTVWATPSIENSIAEASVPNPVPSRVMTYVLVVASKAFTIPVISATGAMNS